MLLSLLLDKKSCIHDFLYSCIMYNIIIFLYLVGVAVLSLFNEKIRKMWRGERHAIRDIKEKIDPEAKYVWVHAASLGEFEQGRPIIERIRAEHPEYKVLLTFFSPSGYEVRKNYEGADIITYLPLDTPRNARRFLRTIRPVCAIFVKYEFWYNYMHILKHRNVPVYSVSSIFRPEQIFFKWYGYSYRNVLKCVTHFFVQNEISKNLLRDKLGLTNVTITGDTRFDRVLQIADQAKELPVIEAFTKDSKTFIAGSSWQPDEDVFIPYLKEHLDWQLIIAPHVIGEDHLQQIEALLEKNGRKAVRYSKLTNNVLPTETGKGEALIIDCFGLLSSIYKYADVTYVGGGFGVGIHNLLEAAVWQKPVIFGPNNQRFQEAQDLKTCEGGHEIKDAASFAVIMDKLIGDKAYLDKCSSAARDYVKSKSGATDIIMNALAL